MYPASWDLRQPVSACAWRQQYEERKTLSTLTRSLNVLVSSFSTAGWGASEGESCSSGAAMMSAGSGSRAAARGTLVNVVTGLLRGHVLGAPVRACRALHQLTGRVGPPGNGMKKLGMDTRVWWTCGIESSTEGADQDLHSAL